MHFDKDGWNEAFARENLKELWAELGGALDAACMQILLCFLVQSQRGKKKKIHQDQHSFCIQKWVLIFHP